VPDSPFNPGELQKLCQYENIPVCLYPLFLIREVPAMAKRQKSAPENTETVKIQPARGKLGVMIPGMGAVATTFVAGV